MINLSIHSGIGTLAFLFLCRQRLTPESHIYSYSYVCPHSLNKFNFAYLLDVIVLHLLSYLIVYTHSLSISIRYSLWLDAFIQLTHTYDKRTATEHTHLTTLGSIPPPPYPPPTPERKNHHPLYISINHQFICINYLHASLLVLFYI